MATSRPIQVGDQVTVNDGTRTVMELKNNTEGGIIIMWASDHAIKQVGGCAPSMWMEWVDGLDMRKRRFSAI
jgi:hypothetical protein